MPKALKIDMKEMKELFDDGMQAARIAYYPPCPKPKLVMRLTPYSDINLLTILHQVNGVDSLHIRKDGIWFPLNFNPDAFVVNVRDILEANVGPSPTLVNPANPPLFRTVGMEQYLQDFYSQKLNGRTYLDHMRIQTAQHQQDR
ncbi:hypothetical protein DITRI_Ditri20bG0089900 [Diplodiscus trichospermus]